MIMMAISTSEIINKMELTDAEKFYQELMILLEQEEEVLRTYFYSITGYVI